MSAVSEKPAVAETPGKVLKLNVHNTRYESGSHSKPALLFIHGWSSSSLIWTSILQRLQNQYLLYSLDLPGHGENADVQVRDIDEFLIQFERVIAPQLPAKYSVVGWSLGGALATHIATRFKESVQALFTICTNPDFVASPRWPYAMENEVFDTFCSRFQSDPARTIDRFYLLQAKGALDSKALASQLRANCGAIPEDCSSLFYGLEWLRCISLHAEWRSLDIPVYHSYGQFDELLHFETAEQVRHCYPAHVVRCYKRSSHLPFITEQQKWLEDFMADMDSIQSGKLKTASSGIDTKAVKSAFSRAADRYDSLATLQWRVASDLLRRETVRRIESGEAVLDLGAGTGFVGRLLPQEAKHNFLQIDISRHMLEKAGANAGSCVQADMDALPLKDEVFDFVVSSLSIQWSREIHALMANCYALLKPGGRMLFSTVLPGSLDEIAQAWKTVDEAEHVHDFCSGTELRNIIEKTGFAISDWVERQYSQEFYSPRDLLTSVSGIGAGNHRRDRQAGLLGKKRFNRLLQGLDGQADESGAIQLGYLVLLAEIRKPAGDDGD